MKVKPYAYCKPCDSRVGLRDDWYLDTVKEGKLPVIIGYCKKCGSKLIRSLSKKERSS